MNIFDNIAKNVRRAQVPAVESLTESEIDGLTFAATTNEDYDTLGAAMEAMGVKTAYKEEKVDKDDLTESEIRQLYNDGMEDEDPDDYEDPYTEETIIDGYIDEAYADEADEALGELTEEDLEDIEDDEGMESYLSAADFEDVAEEGFFKDLKGNIDNLREKSTVNKLLKSHQLKIDRLATQHRKAVKDKRFDDAKRCVSEMNVLMRELKSLHDLSEENAKKYKDLAPITTMIKESYREIKKIIMKVNLSIRPEDWYVIYAATSIAAASFTGNEEDPVAEEGVVDAVTRKIASKKELSDIRGDLNSHKKILDGHIESIQNAVKENDRKAAKEHRKAARKEMGKVDALFELYKVKFANYNEIEPLKEMFKETNKKLALATESLGSDEDEEDIAIEAKQHNISVRVEVFRKLIAKMEGTFKDLEERWNTAFKENDVEKMTETLDEMRAQLRELRDNTKRYELGAKYDKFLHPFEHLIDRLEKKSKKATESFEGYEDDEELVALESKLQRDRVKNAKQRKAAIDQQLKTLNTAIKVKQREIKAYRKEHKKDANYADRLEKLTTDMNDIIAKQTQYSKELAGLNEIINMKGYTESEQARINQMKDAKAQLKLDHKEQAYQAKMARREEDYKRQQDRLDKQSEMAFKQKMAQDARSFMMQDHTADRNLRRLELGQNEDHKMDMYRAERQYNAEMDKMRAELEESRRNSANLAAETNKTIAELQALIEEQKQAAAVQQQNMMQAMQTNMENSLQTKNPFLKKFNQKTMDNFTNMMQAMQANMQAMNVAVASFCYGVNEEDIAEESALDLISAFAPVSDKEHP